MHITALVNLPNMLMYFLYYYQGPVKDEQIVQMVVSNVTVVVPLKLLNRIDLPRHYNLARHPETKLINLLFPAIPFTFQTWNRVILTLHGGIKYLSCDRLKRL